MAADHSWQAVLDPGASDDFFGIEQPSGVNVDANGFSPVNAWWMSELSRLIYRRDQTEGVTSKFSRNDFLARAGLIERHFFNHVHIQAALIETVSGAPSDFAALVFRGTAGRLSNWRFNVDILLCPWPSGGMVHRGFSHLINAVWDAIAAPLGNLTKPLFYTGHSLGGALATLAASLHAPRAVYTFGAPRIGDAAFARHLSKVPVFNVVNPRDIVTQLPPTGRRARFVHAGTIVKNADRFTPYRPLGQAPAFLADHAPLNYTAQLPIAFEN
ncbi:hypothetical protein DSCO28_20030 [Desulfosarcina ovata subsp. sediminis]|uniref:Fungal lipase-type domain-containing protein n=1 Tax=Desulfosarcina ovata subsp. sediminis TaxID=885957 RepID=A0A5K7ZMP3_9BACT|nr:lipase family protein [Desulfosarcina ovata]BBO81437.1 hypothetical protein DSCO28_20030 [Desulfosarcina ovata subsp. sediminis]